MEENNIIEYLINYFKPKAHNAIDGLIGTWEEAKNLGDQFSLGHIDPRLEDTIEGFIMGSIGGGGKKASDIVKFNKAKVGKIKDIYKPTLRLEDLNEQYWIMKHSPKYKKDLKKMKGSDFHKSMKESETYKQLFKNKEGGEDRFTEALNWIMRDTKKTIR